MKDPETHRKKSRLIRNGIILIVIGFGISAVTQNTKLSLPGFDLQTFFDLLVTGCVISGIVFIIMAMLRMWKRKNRS